MDAQKTNLQPSPVLFRSSKLVSELRRTSCGAKCPAQRRKEGTRISETELRHSNYSKFSSVSLESFQT